MITIENSNLARYRTSLKEIDRLMEKGIMTDPGTGLDYFTGYSYKTLYDWDQYFEAIVQIYMGWPSTYIKNGVLIFLRNQHSSGRIPRSVPGNEFHDTEHVKPFLSQISLLVYKAYGDINWIISEPYFSQLKSYVDFWLIGMDKNKNGLSEWMSSLHTGMDNQHERAGYWNDGFCEGVDLNCYLVRELKAFSKIALLAGKEDIAREYSLKSSQLRHRILTLMWDEKDGFFYDMDIRKGAGPGKKGQTCTSVISFDGKIRVKSASSLISLFAGVPDMKQAHRIVYEHIFNTNEFWSPYPVSVLARDERLYSQEMLPGEFGCNWRASTWIPVNYMVYHGLRFYGFNHLATKLAHQTYNLVKNSGNREWYDAETGEGKGLSPFWGWSLLAHFIPFEEEADFNLNIID